MSKEDENYTTTAVGVLRAVEDVPGPVLSVNREEERAEGALEVAVEVVDGGEDGADGGGGVVLGKLTSREDAFK